MNRTNQFPLVFSPEKLSGPITPQDAQSPVPGAPWYQADLTVENAAALEYSFPAGALAGARYLTADALLEGKFLTVFRLILREGEDGREATLAFALLNQSQARVRVPLEFVNQNRRHFGRQGAWLNLRVTGEKLDLSKVDRMTLMVTRRGDPTPRFCLTSFTATFDEPPALRDPILPKGPLLDEMGQSTLHDWAAKTRTAKEVTDRLHRQLREAPGSRWPDTFSRYGGWKEKRFEGTGFFRTQKDGRRWWLVDPDGYAFWSAGLDCVSIHVGSRYDGLTKALSFLPETDGPYRQVFGTGHAGGTTIDYLAVNLIRAFGPETWYDKWASIAIGLLRQLGFNTVANWSDWRIAKAAGFPYVRGMRPRFRETPMIFRDLPDVFEESFAREAGEFPRDLKESAGDPAMIGYFMMNEPQWGFSDYNIAEGMLLGTESCASRMGLCEFLRKRYADDAALAAAWAMPATFAHLAQGRWDGRFTPEASADLEAFSAVMAERFWRTLGEASRAADPDHLNLGVRYHRVPPSWAVRGMECFDVFSMNCYRDKLPAELIEPVSRTLDRPILIGEYHFGALDVGLPAAGLRLVGTQADRAKGFRVYQEDAAAQSWCVGAHYFTMYDQSALGRSDGENYQIGFLDVCNRPYEEMAQAARASSEQLYEVAAGKLPPYDEPPKHIEFRI